MRPERFHYELNNAIEYWLKTGSNAKLLSLTREMERVWKKWAKEEEDYRSGEETYGYEEDKIQNNMIYISDRWRCAFRLRWILDGVKSNKI